MSFLKQLFDQVNMRDGGKTFNNPTGNSGARAGTPPSVMPSAVQASQLSDFFNRPRGTVAGPVANHQPMPYMQAKPIQPRMPIQNFQAPTTFWQNTDGQRRDMLNPQLQEDDYNPYQF